MPGFDKSGPEGKGPQTGRGLGRCNPEPHVKDDEMPRGRGLKRRLRISGDNNTESLARRGRGKGLGRRSAGRRGW